MSIMEREYIRNVAQVKKVGDKLIIASDGIGVLDEKSVIAEGTDTPRQLKDWMGDVVNIKDKMNDIVSVKDFGVKGNGSTDDTEALQRAFDSGKNLLIPDGRYIVTGNGLTITKENQCITWASPRAVIDARNIQPRQITLSLGGQSYTQTVQAALFVGSLYNRLVGPRIVVTDGTKTVNGLQVGFKTEPETMLDGFNCYIEEPYITCPDDAPGLDGLAIQSGETRVYGGKIKGFNVGIHIEYPDAFFANVYTEKNVTHGFWVDGSRGGGSVEAWHVHSYANGGSGFRMEYAAFCNFNGLYADTNRGHGFYILGTANNTTYNGCWGYKSDADGTRTKYDWSINECTNLTLNGCSSSGDTSKKAASFFVNAGSFVRMTECYADKAPQFANQHHVHCSGCRNELARYNRGELEWYVDPVDFINAGSSRTYSVDVVVPRVAFTTPGTIAFEYTYQWRHGNIDNVAGVNRVLLFAGTDVTKDRGGAVLVTTPTANGGNVTFSDVSFTPHDTYGTLTFTVTNNDSARITIGGVLKYLSTGRGLN